jgi:iron(III) transport system ATP-binding protein
MTPQLELRSASLGYEGRIVVRELELRIERGSIACLLGPSGCGKTTALRGIAGFEPLLAGEILIAGRSVSRAGHTLPPEARRIGMVFQDYALFPHLRAGDNVGFGLHRLAAAERARRVSFWLEVVGLGGMARAWPHELSGGQQQRVALARALAPEPDLILLDEPFSNLDPELRDSLAREVADLLRERGATALLVTHDQHEAFAMADHIGILNAGQLQQWDTPYDTYHWPANAVVAGFIGEGVMVEAQLLPNGAVQLPFGRVEAAGRDGRHPLPAPGPVRVLLRPDDVIHDDASPHTARVLRKAFRGAQILYTLELDGGVTALSLVPSHHDHAIGARIGICIAADHVVAFPSVRHE